MPCSRRSERALDGEFGRYRRFMVGSVVVVGALLGMASALFGLWFRRVLFGIGAFAAGGVLTIAAFELMPTVWFPLDRYAVGFVWLLRGAPVAAAIWLVIVLVFHKGVGSNANFCVRNYLRGPYRFP